MLNFIMRKKEISNWAAILFFAVLSILPMFIKSNYAVSILVYCLAFACFGSAWNLIGGYGGQISWCHSAFVAIGAYTGYICLKFFSISPWITMPIGVLISFLFATIIGYGTFKLQGAYFSLATMAFAEILRLLLLYFKDQTGGAAGLYIPYKGPAFSKLAFADDTPFYYLMLVSLAIVLVVVIMFEKTKTGNFLRVIKEDEGAAMSLGIETFRVKLTAFRLSAVITTIVGMIYGFFLSFIEPIGISGGDFAVKIGLVAIIGGLGSTMGPVLGAFIIIPLIEGASVLFGSQGGSQVLYGLGIILVVLFMPDGLIYLFRKCTKISKKPIPGSSIEKGVRDL